MDITTIDMENLISQLKSINPTLDYNQLNQKFQEIAQLLLEKYAIQKGEETYRIREIEFYYHSRNYKDLRSGSDNETLTYQRTCQAGEWFFHPYGFDLAFDSDKSQGFGGGILIRSIQKISTGDVYEPGGNCSDELFDHWSAFAKAVPNAYIVNRELEPEFKVSGALQRKNLPKDNDKRKWRFHLI